MANFQPGDVLVLPFFPNQEDSHSGVPRWVILVEDLGDEFLIVPLTKQTHQVSNYKKCFEIKKGSKEGIQMGLKHDSLAICDRAISLKKIVFRPPVSGTCPDEMIDKIIELLNH